MTVNSSSQKNQGEKEPIVARDYAQKTSDIVEALDMHISKIGNSKNPSDYDKSLSGLWYIIKLNIYFVVHEFSKVYGFYPVAGSVRLIMECVADAKYLQNHQDKATEYLNSQDFISKEMKRLGKKSFNLFKSGDISKYGRLDEKKNTYKRIKKAHGSDGLGAYNFLCCFTHPNIAGAFWFLGDVEYGNKNLYAIGVMNGALATWLEILEESSCFEIDADCWTKQLMDVHKNTLGKIKRMNR